MTGIINRLVQRHLVDRQRDPDNRRALRLSLTPDGQKLIIEIEQLQNQHFETMMARFEPQERTILIQLMNNYLEHLLQEIELRKPQTTGRS
jgi:DNA-binding MarR family transcriptional regulator